MFFLAKRDLKILAEKRRGISNNKPDQFGRVLLFICCAVNAKSLANILIINQLLRRVRKFSGQIGTSDCELLSISRGGGPYQIPSLHFKTNRNWKTLPKARYSNLLNSFQNKITKPDTMAGFVIIFYMRVYDFN